MNREAFYLKLPVSLQNLACSLEGWRIQRSRYDPSFCKLLSIVEERTFWSVARIREYRDQRIREYLKQCVESVPYYRQLFKKNGVEVGQVQKLDDLQHLPILTKTQVQERYPEMISEEVPARDRLIAHTSGTTGGGLRFATTLAAFQEQWAIWWRYRRWHGIQPGTWCGYFGGRSLVPPDQQEPPFWRTNCPGRQIMFSAYHMRPETLKAYAEELRRRRPPWLHGYPSLLALLAGHIAEQGFDLGYVVRWVTTGAENLLPQQVHLIERAFGVRPIQHYGMAEAVANISECEQGNLHVDEDFAAVEFLPNPSGEGCRVVGTNFTNPAVPLVRYDVQDLVSPKDGTCSCGRPGRLVERVDGRLEDYVILKNGARIGRLDHIFKDLVNICEAQILQKRRGELIVRIVRGDRYGEADERSLKEEILKRLGNEADVRFDYVEKLERSRSGKLRFVISELPEASIKAPSSVVA